MLKEFTHVRQEKTGWRRLFSDQYFDLYVWYDREGGEITGFQLVELSGYESRRALTWIRGQGSFHAAVHTKGNFNATPLLVKDGVFQNERIARRFRETAVELPAEIHDLVIGVVEKHREE